MKVQIRRIETTIVEVADIEELRKLRDDFATGREDVQEYCRNNGISGELTFSVKKAEGWE